MENEKLSRLNDGLLFKSIFCLAIATGDWLALDDGTLAFNDFSLSKSLARCDELVSTVSAIRLARELFDKYWVLEVPVE